MIAATSAFGIELIEWGLIGAAVYFALDVMGLGRGSRIVRRQNTDLDDRNKELEAQHEADNTQHENDQRDIANLRAEIVALKDRIVELEKRDQAAVLSSIDMHEVAAGVRHSKTIGVLEEIRDTLRQAA